MAEQDQFNSEENKKLNRMMQVYLNRLMVGALEYVEMIYGKDDKDKFELVRTKILRIGNNQKRDVQEFFKEYISKERHHYELDVKTEDNTNREGK